MARRRPKRGPLKPGETFLQNIVVDRDPDAPADEFPFNLPVFRSFSRMDFHQKVTFFVGENGSGKSTLLEAIALAFGVNPEGGSKNLNFATRESHSTLSRHLRITKAQHPGDAFFYRAESFCNVITALERIGMIDSYGGSLHEQSHGEAFMSFMTNRLSYGLFLFDEPESALSPTRQLGMLGEMHRLVRTGSQMIIATHSPILMAYPDAWIYSFTPVGIERVEYEDTEHVQITRMFLNRRETMLREITRVAAADVDPEPE